MPVLSFKAASSVIKYEKNRYSFKVKKVRAQHENERYTISEHELLGELSLEARMRRLAFRETGSIGK